MSALNAIVSYFPRHNQPGKPHSVNLLTYLRSAKHRAAVERIRQTETPDVRKRLKEELPGITPSGTFTYRGEKHLLKHSGLIAGDIDLKENPYTPESMKREIAKIREVAYCGLSASGNGLWFLVPISDTTRHKEHFAALVADFAAWGFHLDNAPANVASFRFYSFDEAAYFNHGAKPYTKVLPVQAGGYTPRQKPVSGGNDAEKVEAILQQIEARQMDISGTYETWFALACALANGFGEGGRDAFHRLSQFHPNYSTAEADRQFSYSLRMKSNRFSLGTFFEVARQHHLAYKDALPHQSTHTLPRRIEAFTDRHTGKSFELELTAEGYPAAWDE